MDYLKLLGAGAVTVAAVTTTTFYYLTSRPQPVSLPVSLEDQTEEVDVRFFFSSLCLSLSPSLHPLLTFFVNVLLIHVFSLIVTRY